MALYLCKAECLAFIVIKTKYHKNQWGTVNETCGDPRFEKLCSPYHVLNS